VESARPIAGVDYPRTFQEMDDWFRTESGCRDYIRRLRWQKGFVCRRCGAIEDPWVTARGVLVCKACNAETSLTAGTVFQDTRKPLRMWFLAMWFVTSQKNGVSALGLQRVLGLGSYETAWTWLHKLRRAMVRPARERLTGEIEIDETYVGGPEEGKRARETENKAIVVVATSPRREPAAIHPGDYRARRGHSYRWLERLCGTCGRRLSPPHHGDQRQPRTGP